MSINTKHTKETRELQRIIKNKISSICHYKNKIKSLESEINDIKSLIESKLEEK